MAATGKVTFSTTVQATMIRATSPFSSYDRKTGLPVHPSSASVPVTQEGEFPTGNYKITDVKLDLKIRDVSRMQFSASFYGQTASNNEVAIGKITYSGGTPYGQGATVLKSDLNSNVKYDGIRKIVIQSDNNRNLMLMPGNVTLTVTWQEIAPVVYVPKIKDPLVITGVKESKGIEGEARNTQLKVSIEGVDISESVNQYLLGMTYVDNEEDATDDLQIRMHDKESLWLTKWLDDIIQTAAQARYSRTNSQSTSVVIKDNASNYETLSLIAYVTNVYGLSDEADAYYRSIRNNDKTFKEYDVIKLKQYLKLLGYYKKGKLDGVIDNDLVYTVYDYMKARGKVFKGHFENSHWKCLIEDVNGKTDTNYAVAFTARGKFNLLDDANANAAKLAIVEPGTEILVIGKKGSDWYLSEYGGQRGYIQISSGILTFSSVKTITTSTSKISTKGLKIEAGIILRTPDGKERTLNCGEFTLDTVGASGPPSSVVLKATAAPYANGVRTEQRDKAWTKYTLSNIGQEIAKKAGLGYLFDSEKDPTYSRVEQTKQTDLAFLMDLCHRNGCSLKVTDHRLIIFEQSRYEKMEEAITVTFKDGSYTRYDLNTQEGENHYTGCIVRYYNPNTKQIFTGTVLADDADTSKADGNYLTVTNEPVSSNEEAKALANARLRLANKFEKKVSLTMLGNPNLAAGLPIRLKDFGMFDGKYTIRQAKHEVGQKGYTTQITLRAIPDVTVSKGTLKSVTEDLAQKIAVPVEPKDNAGTEFKTTKATGLYRDPTASRNRNVYDVVRGVSEDEALTILGKARNGAVRVAIGSAAYKTKRQIGSAAYSEQGTSIGAAAYKKNDSSIGQAGYMPADAIERK